jgi:antitoxin component YwqK of YwqJK toxin-antitoxin module
MKLITGIYVLISLFMAISVAAQRPADINQTDANGRKTGYWEARHSNGSVRYSGRFHNDKPIGEFRYYYDNGALRAINLFSNNGLRASHTAFSPNGTRIAEGLYFEQKKDSTWLFYSDVDGVLISIEEYKNDKAHGKSITLYPDTEQAAELVNYFEGKRNGEWIKYYEDGSVLNTGFYKDDFLHGPVTFYHPNGKIHIQGRYQEGLKIGLWQTYDEDGNLIEEEIYKERGF